MPRIYIEEWPQPIEAGRLRILEAALDAGVPFPHSCGSGECGTCKCRLIEGEVKRDRHSPDALSDEEVEAGLILACRSRPLTDVRVQWLSGSAPATMIKHDAVVGRVEQASRDVVLLTVRLRAEQAFPFRSGQFAKLRFGRLPARSYSMASQPGERELVFHIRVRPDGQVSQYVANELRAGDPVEVRGPFGEAYWQGSAKATASSANGKAPSADRHLLLLAGGTGMAPILSVLDAALRDGHDPRYIDVYHGVRTPSDLYAEAALHQRARDFGLRFVPVYAEGGPGRTGLLHDAVSADFSDLGASLIHVAGPPPMVDAVRGVAQRRGAAPERIRADAFHASEPEKRSLWERITAWGSL
ncbi:MAG: 2Fe-2S iron-sulfur cluster binding domain-containing protein [Rubrivivax sp.]|nr:2Fe-2S iron-sulfur cluster binding domain-containing protein [Rubrivivax sp.]